MENDQQPIETEGASTPFTEKTADEHGGRQLEQAAEEPQTGTTEDDSGEDEEESDDDKTDTDAEKAATVSAQASSTKSALAKKEERLKRLRELHLRRVCTYSLLKTTKILP